MQNKTIKKGYVIPAIIALILAVCSLIYFKSISFAVPYGGEYVRVAYSDSDTVAQAKAIPSENGEVSKGSIPAFSENTSIGSIELGEARLPIVYNAYDSVAADSVAMENGVLIGETGTAVGYITKNNSSFLEKIEEGDIVKAELAYGSYTLVAVKTDTFKSRSLAKGMNEGFGRTLVLCADTTGGIGVGLQYSAVCFVITEGNEITE